MAKGDELEERLIRFAVRVLKLCAALPDTGEGRHVRGQLIRSGTAPAPHYAEGRGAESTRVSCTNSKFASKNSMKRVFGCSL